MERALKFESLSKYLTFDSAVNCQKLQSIPTTCKYRVAILLTFINTKLVKLEIDTDLQDEFTVFSETKYKIRFTRYLGKIEIIDTDICDEVFHLVSKHF